MNIFHSIFRSKNTLSPFFCYTLTLTICLCVSNPAFCGQQTPRDDVEQAIAIIKRFPAYSENSFPEFLKSKLYKQGEIHVKHALDNYTSNSPEDRAAIQKLVTTIKQSCIKSCFFILESILRRFAELEIPVNDSLANTLFISYARSIDSNNTDFMPRSFSKAYVASKLIIEADTNLQRLQDYLLAAYVYRKAIELGVDKLVSVNMYTIHINDKTPTSIKLSDVLGRLGKRRGSEKQAKNYMSSQDVPVGCQDSSFYSFYSSLLVSAKVQLANHNKKSALATTKRVLDGLSECAKFRSSRHLDIFLEALAFFGQAQWAADDPKTALRTFAKFATSYEDLLATTLMELSEAMAIIPYVRSHDKTDVALSFLSTQTDSIAIRIALGILASRTGRLLEMQADRISHFRSCKKYMKDVLKLRSKRATLVLRGRSRAYQEMLAGSSVPANLSAPDGTPFMLNAIGQLAFSEDQLTWAAARYCSPSGDPFVTRSISISNIMSSVDKETAVLVYARIPRIEPWTGKKEGSDYVVWIIGPFGSLMVQPLGDVVKIDQLIEKYITLIKGKPSLGLNQKNDKRSLIRESKKLFKLLLPKWSVFSAARRLIVIPDGLIHTIPFAALQTESDEYLVEKMDVWYANSLREFTRHREVVSSLNPPIFFANPIMSNVNHTEGIYHPVTLTKRAGTLPGADREVRDIAKKQFAGKNARIYSGKDATEASIKLEVSPSILHIASHGYYIQNSEDDFLDNFFLVRSQPNGLSADYSTRLRLVNPLFRSYLAFAEYNQVRRLDEEDGILTAAEILGINLKGTDLAVVSACTVGNGPIQHGEGIYGMQVALSLAGAKTQVLSLWEIDDTAARAFMNRYYALMLSGHPKLEAFAQTQRDYIKDDRFHHPHHWAVFKAAGDNSVLGLVGTNKRVSP